MPTAADKRMMAQASRWLFAGAFVAMMIARGLRLWG